MRRKIWRRRLLAFWYAFRGLGHLIRSEVHARVHLTVTVLVLALGGWLRLSPGEWAWLVLAIGLVWVAEAFNTALERALDALHPEYHPRIGLAKDLAAAAVLLAAMTAAVLGLLVLLPALVRRW